MPNQLNHEDLDELAARLGELQPYPNDAATVAEVRDVINELRAARALLFWQQERADARDLLQRLREEHETEEARDVLQRAGWSLREEDETEEAPDA